MEVTMDEIGEITDYVQEEAGYGTDLIWGNCNDESLGEKIIITLIATGFEGGSSRKKELNASIRETPQPEVKRVPLERPFDTVIEEDEMALEFGLSNEAQVIEFDTFTPGSHSSVTSREMPEEKPVRGSQPRPGQESKHPVMSEELLARREADAARREFLRKANSKPLDNPKIISDLESVPAYTRRNVVLEDEAKNNGQQKSKYSVNMDDDGTLLITNNSYLYDNVD
jgi:cell division protein FtsZ